MAIDKRFTNATSSNSGLTGIENFYNSYNKLQNDSVVLQTVNGNSITLTDILKNSAKYKDFGSLTKEDFVEGVLPSIESGVDETNFTHLMSLIANETTLTAPKLIINGMEETVEKSLLRTQTVFLRIYKTNDKINLRDILKNDVKNKPLQAIVLDDIDESFIPEAKTRPAMYDSLLQLIRGETVDADEEIVLAYNGKMVQLDHDTYVQEGVATDISLKVGETATSSAKREYYTAMSTGIDKTPRYVESKQIIPPAYKITNVTNSNHINNAQNLSRLLDGQQIAIDGVISYEKNDGTIGYRKNQEVAMIDGELFAVPEGYKVDTKNLHSAEQEKHLSKRVKLGEMKVSNVVGGITGQVTKKYNVAHDKFDVIIDGRKRVIECYPQDHHFVIIGNGGEEFVFGDEEYFNATSHNGNQGRTTFRVTGFSYDYDQHTGDFRLNIAFVDNYFKNAIATANASQNELVSSKLVADNKGNITQIKSEKSATTIERTFNVNDIAGINLNVKCDKAFVGNFNCYQPAPLFAPQKDATGNIVYKKDNDGNIVNDANGRPIPEEKINADLLQTVKTDENGELKTFDFAENDRLVKEFEQDILKLQEEIVKLKENNTNDENIKAIKDLKRKLDDKLEKIKDIRNKTSIKSVNKIIEDYQNGEFFETFFFDEKGEMFEIKNGKKIALSSNSSADYNNLMADVIGKYTVENNKGKCKVVFSEKATSIIGGSLKIAETLYAMSLSTGLLSLVVLPFALTIGTGAIAFAGATATFNLVRNKLKQFQLNRLTPEKLKKIANKKCVKATKEDIKKATKEYKQKVSRIKKNTLDEQKKNILLDEAKKQFLTKRAQIVGRLSTLDDITIQSKFSVKDKKITLANIYGRAEWKQQNKNAKKGAKLDYNTRRATRDAEIKYKQEYEDKLNALPKDTKYRAEKARLKKQYKIAVADAVNEYKAKNGKAKGAFSRLHYLKKTLAYRNADNVTQLQMEKDCREAMSKVGEIKEVESTTLMSKNSNATRGKLIKFIETNSPKDLPVTAEESAMLLNQEEKRAIQVKDRQLARTHTAQAEKDYNNVADFVDVVEKSAETIANKETKNEEINGEELLNDIKNHTKEKADKIRKQKEQGKTQKQEKLKKDRAELTERKKKAKEYNDALIATVFTNGPIKDIASRGDLSLYARTWYRENKLDAGVPDEEKISTFLNEMSTQDQAGRDTYLDALQKSNYFRSSYKEIKQEQNEMMIGELMTKGAEFVELDDQKLLLVMSKIFVKMIRYQGHAVPRPKFSIVKKDASGNIVKTPHYSAEELNNMFLRGLKDMSVENAKHLIELIHNQKEYQDYIAKNLAYSVTP